MEATGLICLGNTEPGIRRVAESVLGGFVPSRQHRFADFQLQGTLSGSAGGYSLSSAFQRLSDSLRFRPGREDAESIVLEVMPKTAGIAQMWPLSVPASRRSRSFSIRNRRQSIFGPLIFRRKRNAKDARPRVCGSGRLGSHNPTCH